jgi:hypothetical protein
MRVPSPLGNSTALADELSSVRQAELAHALRYDLTSYNGPSICFGIMLAGAAYPIIIAIASIAIIIVQIFGSLNRMSPGPNLVELAVVPFFLVGYAALGSMLGIIWAGVLSMITLPVVYAFVRSLKLRGSLVWLGAVSGGLVGFIAALPVTLSVPWTIGLGDYWELLIALSLGPGLATVLGQIGGAWGGLRATRHIANYYGVVGASNSDRAEPVRTGLLTDANDFAPRTTEQHWQFGIRHIMWLIVWISLLLSVIRLSGIPFEYVLPLVAGWILFQWLTLRVGWRLAQWLCPKWTAWRSLRST